MPESQNNCASRHHVAANRRSKSRRKRLAAALSILCTIGMCGCSTSASLRSLSSSGTWNDTVETLRNRSYSAKAYYRRQHNFCNFSHSKDFKAGFRAGYEAIADGKPGCPPAFPPKEYWSWEFQSAEGQARTAAWFEGYPYGVQAAREDGMNQWSQLIGSSGLNGDCSSPTANGQCGCGHCAGAGQVLQGYPIGSSPLNMSIGDQDFQQGAVLDGYTISPSDQGSALQTVPQSTTAPATRSDFPAPSPFPTNN